MAHAFVRVELHAATSVAEYAALHHAMATIGFQRTITAGSGKTYQLPTAIATIEEARDAAWKASAVVF
jgi:hypothetical protein